MKRRKRNVIKLRIQGDMSPLLALLVNSEDERRIQRRIAEMKYYYGKDYDSRNLTERIEEKIRKVNGDYSIPGILTESGRSVDGGCDRY